MREAVRSWTLAWTGSRVTCVHAEAPPKTYDKRATLSYRVAFLTLTQRKAVSSELLFLCGVGGGVGGSGVGAGGECGVQ
jgi:hypothetical protein